MRIATFGVAAVALLAVTACSPADITPPQAAPTAQPAPDAPALGQPAPRRPQHPSREQAATATVEPVAASTPRRLARQLERAERTIRDPDATRAQTARAGHVQQVAYRAWGNRPAWDARVLRNLPRRLWPVARHNVRAHRELASMSSGRPPQTLPRWRIVTPAPRRELMRYYRKAQERFGVRWEYLAAIHLVETRMGRIDGVSSAGARGPMQFIPATWKLYGRGDIEDNHDAIMAAGRYLRARGAPRDMDRALYSYNNDVRYVRAVRHYADVMKRNPRAYRGYHGWQVYYRQPGGAVWLPEGWDGR
ncbi:MAG TPA: transglycosylase SLT domain-containing protein [Egibacteraceae bacterium]|nr:transglycosylase SLT domain-containing protein [Egibacteraceae bacterium]